MEYSNTGQIENQESQKISKRDIQFSALAGLLIGLLLMPILKAANPVLYEMLFLAVVPVFLVATPLGIAIAFRIGTKIRVIWQLAKFIVTGVLNTVVDLGALALITFLFKNYLNINSKDSLLALGAATITFYSLYKGFSFILANINSYYWNKYWTFQKTSEKTAKELTQFFTVSIIGLAINIVTASYVFGSIHALAGLNSDQWGLIGAAFGSIAGLAWNFIGYKIWVFKK